MGMSLKERVFCAEDYFVNCIRERKWALNLDADIEKLQTKCSLADYTDADIVSLVTKYRTLGELLLIRNFSSIHHETFYRINSAEPEVTRAGISQAMDRIERGLKSLGYEMTKYHCEQKLMLSQQIASEERSRRG